MGGTDANEIDAGGCKDKEEQDGMEDVARYVGVGWSATIFQEKGCLANANDVRPTR